MTLPRKLQEYRRTAAALGLGPAIVYKLQKLRASNFRLRSPFVLYSKHASHGLRCRPQSSDLEVFQQIFVSREYRCLDDVEINDGLIIDCGANAGYASAYFLSRYPACDLIAVEPDAANFAILKANVSPFGGRCRALHTALWSHPTSLSMSEQTAGEGKEWARQVREAGPGDQGTFEALDIGTLLAGSKHSRIAILKIDIEGAEAEVFARNFSHWLDKVDNLVIELHGPACEAVFHRAIANAGFTVSHCDELTVCKRGH